MKYILISSWLLTFFIDMSFAQEDPCLDCKLNCYEPYFINLEISDSCQFSNNAERFREKPFGAFIRSTKSNVDHK